MDEGPAHTLPRLRRLCTDGDERTAATGRTSSREIRHRSHRYCPSHWSIRDRRNERGDQRERAASSRRVRSLRVGDPRTQTHCAYLEKGSLRRRRGLGGVRTARGSWRLINELLSL